MSNTFIHPFIDELLQLQYIDMVVLLTGVVSCFYSIKQRVATYPFGIVCISLSIFLCYKQKIYGDMGVNIFYFIMSCYGWYNWSINTKKDSRKIKVAYCSTFENFILGMTTLLSYIIIFFSLKNFTDSNIYYIDSFTTALMITGMILMALRKIENWIYFIVADAISIPLYIYKELYFSATLFFILTLMAIVGLIKWKKDLITNE